MSEQKTVSKEIIPAQPGFYQLDLREDGSVSRAAIVAWFIEHEEFSFANPITVHGSRAGHMLAILQPDGEILRPFCADRWTDVDAWAADMRYELADVRAHWRGDLRHVAR
jgi:hypothetical protein